MSRPTDDLYERYRTALTDLAGIPARLADEIAEARREHERDAARQGRQARAAAERLARLRRAAAARYSDAARTVRGAGVLLPAQVRPEPGQPGDDAGLAAALRAQQETVAAVTLEVRVALATARGDPARNAGVAPAGQQAAEALRERHRRARPARAELPADTERERQARQSRAGRTRMVIIAAAVAAVLAAAMAGVVLVT